MCQDDCHVVQLHLLGVINSEVIKWIVTYLCNILTKISVGSYPAQVLLGHIFAVSGLKVLRKLHIDFHRGYSSLEPSTG